MGIPMWKAAEVTLIWLLAVLLAVPEALAFDMLEMPYRGNKLRVCLLHPEQSGSFMKVSKLGHLYFVFFSWVGICGGLSCQGLDSFPKVCTP